MNKSKVIATVAMLVFTSSALPILVHAFSEHSIYWGIRRTVDIAFPLLFLSFGASSLHYLFKSKFTLWLMRNRRSLGIAFGISFLAHASLILLLAALYPDPFVANLSNRTIHVGYMAFSVTAIMTLTSNDFSVERLGLRTWTWVHTVCGYYLSIAFLGTYLSKVADPFFWPYACAAVTLIALRLLRVVVRKFKHITNQSNRTA